MNTFCDWLSETIVISVYDSFFKNYISIVLLSFIVFTSQSQRLFILVRSDPSFGNKNDVVIDLSYNDVKCEKNHVILNMIGSTIFSRANPISCNISNPHLTSL